jgi:hypothetical protein
VPINITFLKIRSESKNSKKKSCMHIYVFHFHRKTSEKMLIFACCTKVTISRVEEANLNF